MLAVDSSSPFGGPRLVFCISSRVGPSRLDMFLVRRRVGREPSRAAVYYVEYKLIYASYKVPGYGIDSISVGCIVSIFVLSSILFSIPKELPSSKLPRRPQFRGCRFKNAPTDPR